jgi:hypothetical protein
MARRIPTWTYIAGGGILLLAAGRVAAPIILRRSEAARIAALRLDTKTRILELRRKLLERGIAVHIGSTARSVSEQASILASGRTTTPGSWHLVGRAADVYPIDPKTGKPDYAGRRVDLYRIMVEEAEKLGLRSLAFNPDGSKRTLVGKKGPFWDGGHLEYRGPFATVAQAAKAEGLVLG